MRSRTVRLVCATVAVIVLGASAFQIFRSEKDLARLRADGRLFDLRAREIATALADLRTAQQAYVAVGQGVTFWMPKVADTTERIRTSIDALRATATSAAAQTAIAEAAETLDAFGAADGRAREYLRAGQLLMAGDVIFSEGDQSAGAAARSIETARLAEHQALDAGEARVRRDQAIVLAGAAGLTAMLILVLAFTGAAVSTAAEQVTPLGHAALPAAEPPRPPAPPAAVEAPTPKLRPVSPVLKAAAQLCADFACVRDINDLDVLIARVSDVMDAAGLVVWLGDADGAALRPVLAHGYSEATRARLPNVPRSANNAAAAAYRSGEVQIVLSRPGGAKGAVVAPILGPRGCIGALSAEIRGGGEASESVQAIASIVAAQLSGVLAAEQADVSRPRAAASS
jgi:hypothetical protein